MLLGNPAFRLQQAAWLDRQPVFPAADLAAHQARRLQDGDMSGDSGEGHRERLRKVGDPGIAGPKGDEEGTPRGMREGREGPIDMFNHFVEDSRRLRQ